MQDVSGALDLTVFIPKCTGMAVKKKRRSPKFKYQEDKILKEVAAYITATYGSHYALPSGVQALDLIFSSGHGKAHCAACCIKYYARYGRKAGFNRDDLLKAIHYGILLLHLDSAERK